MKQKLIILICGFIAFSIYAQEQEDAITQFIDNPLSVNPVSQLILHGDVQGVPLRKGAFELADGTLLDYTELKEKLFTVPNNETYIRRAKGWEIAQWIASFACVGFVVADLVYLYNDHLPHAEGIREICRAGTWLSLVFAPTFYSMRNKNLNRAVRNYNLYIMGIPVKTP
jgi:hypothetical protein